MKKSPSPFHQAWAKWFPWLRVVMVLSAAWLVLGLLTQGAMLYTAPLARVQVEGNQELTRQEILQWTGLGPGTPLNQLDPFQIAQRLSTHPQVRQADARRRFPGGLWLWVEERKPLALALGRDGRFLLLDDEGVIVGQATSAQGLRLPRLAGAPLPGRPGEKLNVAAVTRGLAALAAARQVGLNNWATLTADGRNPLVTRLTAPAPGPDLWLTPGAGLLEALVAYQAWASQTDDTRLFRVVDLRLAPARMYFRPEP
ncbi:MAG: FtsQ-type POTRA domain-containing protein [Deltaproteobacteria bacterium]|nr:FtsQ-type POTRA domain-containing protein [Deltaproteobacteria bacterium]